MMAFLGVQGFRHAPGGITVWPGPAALALTLVIGLCLSALPISWAIFLFVAIVVLLLALIQPLFALALALIAGPFGALESVILGGLSFDSGQLLLLLALATWLARRLVDRKINLPNTPLTAPLFLFVGLAAASLVVAPDPNLGLREVIKWIEITTVMLMVTDLGGKLGSERGEDGRLSQAYGVWWIVVMLMIAGVIQAVIGIWQFMFRGDGPEHFIVLGRFYRAYGTFEQPNPFGGFMNLTALLALGILIGLFTGWLLQKRGSLIQIESSRPVSSMRLFAAILAVAVVAAATLLGLFFSWSRGAWMGFLAGLAAMVIFWPRRLRYGLFLLFIALVGFLFLFQSELLPPTIMERVIGFAGDLSLGDVRGVDINDENYAVLERLAHWQAALDMAGDHLWFGVGFGNYAAAYSDYALINWPDPLGHAHNYYLNTMAEIGFIGLGAYVLLWGLIFWQTWRVLARETWPVRGVALGLIAIWTALAVHHLVDKLYVNNIYIHLGVLLGLLQLVDLHAGSSMPERD